MNAKRSGEGSNPTLIDAPGRQGGWRGEFKGVNWKPTEQFVTGTKVRDVVKTIEEDGWVLDRTRGDHRQYVHAAKPGTVTVPGHPGDDMPPRDAKLGIEAGRAEAMNYAVVFEKATHNWAAYVPDLPGCVTTSPSLEEARRLIAEVIEFHIEGLHLRGESVPAPTTVAEVVKIRAA